MLIIIPIAWVVSYSKCDPFRVSNGVDDEEDSKLGIFLLVWLRGVDRTELFQSYLSISRLPFKFWWVRSVHRTINHLRWTTIYSMSFVEFIVCCLGFKGKFTWRIRLSLGWGDRICNFFWRKFLGISGFSFEFGCVWNILAVFSRIRWLSWLCLELVGTIFSSVFGLVLQFEWGSSIFCFITRRVSF